MTGLLKNFFHTSFKHKKLSEDWAQLQNSVGEGVTFACRDLGSTMVTEAQNEAATAEAIRRVIHLVRATHVKPKRVALHVSSTGVRVRSAESGEIIKETDIYDIAYCSADSHFNHVVAFIANGDKNVFECYAYLCQSSKMAQTVAVSIAHAFNMVYNGTLKNASEDAEDKKNCDKDSSGENILIGLEESVSSERLTNENDSSSSMSNEAVSPRSPQKLISRGSIDISLRELDPLYEKYEKLIMLPPIIVSPRKRRKKNQQSNQHSDQHNQHNDHQKWVAVFEEVKEKDFNEKFSNLRMNSASNDPCFYTKPPQRCKSNLSDLSFEELKAFTQSAVVVRDLNWPNMDPEKYGNCTVNNANDCTSAKLRTANNATSPTSANKISCNNGAIEATKTHNGTMSESRFQLKSFDNFEDAWCQFGETFDSASFGKLSPSDEPFSLSQCQSPSPFGSKVSYKWTSFAD